MASDAYGGGRHPEGSRGRGHVKSHDLEAGEYLTLAGWQDCQLRSDPGQAVDLVVRFSHGGQVREVGGVETRGLTACDATPVIGGQVPGDAEQIAGEVGRGPLETGDLACCRQPGLCSEVLGVSFYELGDVY